MLELLWQVAEEEIKEAEGKQRAFLDISAKARRCQEGPEDTAFAKDTNHSLAVGAPTSLRSSVEALLYWRGAVATVMGQYHSLVDVENRSQVVSLLWWDLLDKRCAIITCGPDGVFLEHLEDGESLAYNLIMAQLDYHSLMPLVWTPQTLNVSLIASWPKMVQMWDT